MNHQTRILKAIEANLEGWEPSLEMTWDQTVASNVGFVGSVWPGEITARYRFHCNFQADYATFAPVKPNGQISDRKIYANFHQHAKAEEAIMQVVKTLCGC
jgi:hypothetical protein